MGSQSQRALVVPGQVQQLATDLACRQVQEVSGRLRRTGLQGAEQTQQGVLEHVVGFLPALQPPIVAQHGPRQLAQALARAVEQLLAGSLLAGEKAVQAALQLGRGLVGHKLS